MRKMLANLAVKQRSVLKAFVRAIKREMHILTQEPDLLWQQLYNRLQWEGRGSKSNA